MSHKIACIIPSYNHAEYIAEKIRSVVRQTLPPERMVIVDDRSQDRSLDVIRAVRDPMTHLVAQTNQGADAASTRGLELAKNCHLFGVLNSGNRYQPEGFASCFDHLD